MSWLNPTPREAEEEYAYYRSRYNNAASQKRKSEQQESSFVSEKNSLNRQLRPLSSQKTNFEKRMNGIDKIIKMLEGRGGWLSVNVPDVISKTNTSLRNADNSYRRSIVVTNGNSAASLDSVFHVKTIDEDIHSSGALQQFKSEKARIEEELADLNKQISALSSSISNLTKKINACNATQADLNTIMRSSALEMEHFKRYIR